MSTSELIPREVLHRFLRMQTDCRVLLVAVTGSHASGYAHQEDPIELQGIHIEWTERLVGLILPPTARNWVGEFENHRVDYSSLELGEALRRLLRGDRSVLERILAPVQLLKNHDIESLQRLTREVISKRFHGNYRTVTRGVRESYAEEGARRSARHLLGIYRCGLTGVHLLRTGEIEFDLPALAKRYGFPKINELIEANQSETDAVLEPKNPWINRMVRLHSLIEEAYDLSDLPKECNDPSSIEEYLMDMRRRFFDAATVATG